MRSFFLFSRGLTNLVELDLSRNALKSLPDFSESDCKYLMRLSLRGNQITAVPEGSFDRLGDLNSLDLGECGIEVIGEGVFKDLANLEYLRLENNKITTMSPSRSFPPKLR